MVIMQNSEYRRHFVPKFESFKQEYTENVGYRSARRSREFSHNRDVFTWEPEQWEKKSCTSVLQDEVRPGVNPSFQYKHALYNKDFQERQLSRCLQEQCNINGQANPPQSSSQEPQTPPPSPQYEESPVSQTSAPAQTENAVNGNIVQQPKPKTNTGKKPRKPRTVAPTGQVIITKERVVRPKSCQAGPATAKAVSLRPPFVMFGCKDKEPQMGVKRTHNVKSPIDVYPSAIRASLSRQDKKARRPKSAPASGKKRPVLFDIVMDRETSCWQTEYGGHFVQYKPAEYERNAVSRMSVKRCTDI